MILLDDTAPANLAGVSTLRRALRRCLAELRLPEGAGDDLQLAVAWPAPLKRDQFES